MIQWDTYFENPVYALVFEVNEKWISLELKYPALKTLIFCQQALTLNNEEMILYSVTR